MPGAGDTMLSMVSALLELLLHMREKDLQQIVTRTNADLQNSVSVGKQRAGVSREWIARADAS